VPKEQYTIGQVARTIGVPARTIRFWCDAGILPPTDRSAGGYRQFDAAAVARLDLVRTLRELGLGLDDIRQVLHGGTTVAELARVHAAALDAQIRVLRLRRAVLRAVAARGSDIEETKQMNDLARLSARERQQIIEDFVDRAFAGVPPNTIAQRMRTMPAELPDDPTPEQVDAWIELAGLVADGGFARRTRAMVLAGPVRGGPDHGASPASSTRARPSPPRPPHTAG
jgi:DNA-binding transcriptional MerR regulator